MRKRLIAALAAGGLIIVGPAGAEDIEFSYSAYELETAGGAAALYERLENRATAACTHSGRKSLEERRIENACIERLTRDFVEAIGHERIARAHRARDYEKSRLADRL